MMQIQNISLKLSQLFLFVESHSPVSFHFLLFMQLFYEHFIPCAGKKGSPEHPDGSRNEAHLQLSKFTSSIVDVIFIYRSQQADYHQLNKIIDQMTNKEKPLLVIGDFNFCFLEASNLTKLYFQEKNFKQIINEPTHIGGHLLDQAYLRDRSRVLKCTVEIHSKYYTDHKALAITIKKVKR